MARLLVQTLRLSLLWGLAFFAAACSVDSFVSFKGIDPSRKLTPRVGAAFGKDGMQWNSYVRDDAATVHHASGVLCDGTENTYRDCLHAGELRKFTLPSNYTSCAGLTPADALDFFNWVCEANAGVVTFYSTGLKEGITLRDLIDFNAVAFKKNYIKVTQNSVSRMLTSWEDWWPENAVFELPDNSGPTDQIVSLDVPGAVYILKADRTSQGYSLAAQRISIVAPSNVTLRYTGQAGNNCNFSTGTTASPNATCLLFGNAAHEAWLEINISGFVTSGTSARPVVFANMQRVKMKNVKLENLLNMTGVQNSQFENVIFNYGNITLSSFNGNLLKGFKAFRAAILLADSNRNVLDSGSLSSSYANIDITGVSSHNSFSHLVLQNANLGLQISGASSTHNIFSRITAVNTSGDGIGAWSGVTRGTLHNILSTNTGNHGLQIGSPQVSVSQIAAANTLYRGIVFTSSANYGKAQGLFMLGNNPSGYCGMSAVTAPAMNGSCVAANLSTGLMTTVLGNAVTSASSVVGKVTADSVNLSHASGTATYPASGFYTLFDFFNFLNPTLEKFNLYKGWGRENASAFPASTHRGTWTSGTGRIWDFSLRSTDTVFLSKSANGTTTNTAITAGAACPAWLSGDEFLTDLSQGEVAGDGIGNDNGICEVGEACLGHHFLRNAYEIAGDRIGNDNGLCESGEACIATPNIGAYQGHGDYKLNSCIFQNGSSPDSVQNVQMYFYPHNGL